MCEQEELLGEFHSVARDATEAAATREAHVESVAELIRHKTGFDVEPVAHPGGLVAFRSLQFRAFALKPEWCRPGKRIDMQDPRRLAAKFETSPREDGLIDCKASVYLLAASHD
jgi:hypothetical protein